LANYIQQRPSGYYFRYAIPKRFLSIVSVHEFKYSLCTRSRSIAKQKARTIVVSLDQLLQQHLMNRTELTDSKVRELVKQFTDEARDYIEESHLTSPLHPEINPANYEAAVMLQAESREQLAQSRFSSSVIRQTQELLAEAGITTTTESIEFKEMCRQITRAQQQLNDYALSLGEGRDTPEEPDYITSLNDSITGSHTSSHKAQSKPISHYTENWLANLKASN